MEKIITLRYATKCAKCGATLPAGSRAVWIPDGNTGAKVRHEMCSVNVEPNLPKESSAKVTRFTRDYADVRHDFKRLMESPGTFYRQARNASSAESLSRDIQSGGNWIGCSIAEINDWIQNGFRVEGLNGVSSLIPGKPRRKLKYGEEGDELLLDLAWSGDDTPFIEWEKRVSKPGLSVEIHCTFSAIFPAKVIAQYQRWIARALQTLDENGVDMEVNLVVKTSGANSDNPAEIHESLIRVRKPGEAADFANWSAMFSPGGYRGLGIFNTGLNVDANGGRVSGGYGRPMDYGSWDVAYDPERNVIVIGNLNDAFSAQFPELEMTDKLIAVLTKLNG